MREKILVTGDKGFLGKKVIEKLNKKGYFVKGFDFADGKDLLDFEECQKTARGCDAVVHCAAVLDEHSPFLEKVNLKGTDNIARASAENKIKHFVFISTSGVYGNNLGKTSEKKEKKPVTRYEKSKSSGEDIALEYQELMDITILRPAIIIGNNKYWKKIFEKIKKGFPIIGNGQNRWHLVHVEDVADAIIFVLENKEAHGEIFNVAADDVLNLEELVVEIKKAAGFKSKTFFTPVWIGKIVAFFYSIFSPNSIINKEHLERLSRNRHYCIEKIKKAGWEPKIKARDAIKKTIEEMRV